MGRNVLMSCPKSELYFRMGCVLLWRNFVMTVGYCTHSCVPKTSTWWLWFFFWLTSYHVTEEVCAEAERVGGGGRRATILHIVQAPPPPAAAADPRPSLLPWPWSQPGGMMLQEAWCTRGDSATPWWQPPLHLLFDWLPEGGERKGREGGGDAGWRREGKDSQILT